MNRRTAITTALALPALTGCYYDQYFEVSWDEEVKLHDGRVIVVKLKFFYERLSRTSKYGKAILRDTELSFDAGLPRGRVTQLFKRVRPVMLDQFEGIWYVVLQGLGGSDSPKTSGQDWGETQNFYADRIARLGSSGFEAIPIHELPKPLDNKNLLHDYAPVEEWVAFGGRLVDLNTKATYSAKYRPHPSDAKLIRTRPEPAPQQTK
jgi:hypothetical protein